MAKTPSPQRDDEAKALRAVVSELTDTQWYDAERLATYQSAALRPLLLWAKQHVPYYARKLGDVSDQQLEEFHVGKMHELPLLDRRTIRERGKELFADAVPQEHGTVQDHSTSGSTGTPVVVRTTSYSMRWAYAYHMRDHYWHQRDLSQPLIGIRSGDERKGGIAPDALTRPGWGRAVSRLHDSGTSHFLHINSPVAAQIEYIQRIAAPYLLTFPTNLEALARYCLEHGIRLDSLVEVRTVSEALPEGLRELVREAWGVKLSDVYSCRELGSLAIQCPEHEHYHVSAENVVLEILDDDDRPCAPGERGRVVVTGLRGYASPLIRYDIGDFAEVGEPCDCGRGLPVLGRIVGRTRNRIKTPNGRHVWPRVGYRMFAGSLHIVRQIQFVQSRLDTITVKIVAPRHLTDAELSEANAAWAVNFGYPFRFEVEYVDAIPRSAGGKFEDVLCELD